MAVRISDSGILAKRRKKGRRLVCLSSAVLIESVTRENEEQQWKGRERLKGSGKRYEEGHAESLE